MLSFVSSSRSVNVLESATSSSRMTLKNVSFSGLPTQNSNPKQNKDKQVISKPVKDL